MANEHVDVMVYLVAGWDTGPIHERDAVAVRIKYLDVKTQQRSETPFFGVPRGEVERLVESLNQALAKLGAPASDPDAS